MARKRADVLLVERGLARSRTHAREAIEAGQVRAGGRVIAKPSDMLEDGAEIVFAAAHPWVSRGGVKLAHGLDAFGIDPKGAVCLDIGAATGGFSHVLVTRGAARVYAVDVGHGQFDAELAKDPRIVVMEFQDARALTRALIPEPPSLVVCDASFIGAEKVLSQPLSLAAERADLVALVKPQFESGPRAKEKLPESEARRLAEETAGRLHGLSRFRAVNLIESPLSGGAGAVEFLLHARRAPSA